MRRRHPIEDVVGRGPQAPTTSGNKDIRDVADVRDIALRLELLEGDVERIADILCELRDDLEPAARRDVFAPRPLRVLARPLADAAAAITWLVAWTLFPGARRLW